MSSLTPSATSAQSAGYVPDDFDPDDDLGPAAPIRDAGVPVAVLLECKPEIAVDMEDCRAIASRWVEVYGESCELAVIVEIPGGIVAPLVLIAIPDATPPQLMLSWPEADRMAAIACDAVDHLREEQFRDWLPVYVVQYDSASLRRSWEARMDLPESVQELVIGVDPAYRRDDAVFADSRPVIVEVIHDENARPAEGRRVPAWRPRR